DRRYDRQTFGVAGKVMQERAVDLQCRHREPRQVVERRVSGAEVVDRNFDAELANLLQLVDRVGDVRQQCALGDLDVDARGVPAGSADDVGKLAEKATPAKLHRGNIDGDTPRRQTFRAPTRDIL